MENEVIDSWKKNAKEWVKVIDRNKIESRQYTNKAIEGVLREMSGNNILDMGCGEGWLTRSITEMGKRAVGIDVIETLLVNARKKGPESFFLMSYEDIMIGRRIPEGPYDMAIFNFSIYQKDGLVELLNNTRKFLLKNGKIAIQTIHPYFLLNNGMAYRSQMISDSWKGLPGNFTEGHQWYARTIEDWISIIAQCGMKIVELREIINFDKEPVSLILISEIQQSNDI